MIENSFSSKNMEEVSGRILNEQDYLAFLNIYINHNNRKDYLTSLYNQFKGYNENFLGYFYKTANDRLNREYERQNPVNLNKPDQKTSETMSIDELKRLVNDVLRDATLIQDEEDKIENN